MNTLENIISKDEIIKYLCRARAKYAKQRGRRHLIHLLTTDKRFNYHVNCEKNQSFIRPEEKILSEIFPSRRKWKKLGKSNRYRKNGQRINSIDYNVESLLLTIWHYRKNSPAEPFLKKLNLFVEEIQDSIIDPSYKITPPTIYPKPKNNDNKDGIYRPIAIFSLKDRVIIRFINKYYTNLFDKYFYERSFAFRASQKNNGISVRRSHHEAAQEIQNYRDVNQTKHLWVAESDICKFYDSVNHSVIRKYFKVLIRKAKKEFPKDYDQRAEHIFYDYLNSYSFVKDIWPLNNDPKYWLRNNIANGKFEWIKPELLKKIYKKYKGARIGVPQGGALSGLIANIVLDAADKIVTKTSDNKLLYVRFCDDMVLIHPNKKMCSQAIRRYDNALFKLKLPPHERIDPPVKDSKGFWDVKSKGPYRWSLNNDSSFQWLGFVGYEIRYDGSLRVRKKSLSKELTKQRDVIDTILKAIKKGRRESDGTVIESATNRLIGMSVGRIKLWNYDKAENEMCWVKGFANLINNNNIYLREQLRQLDRGRNKQISTLKKQLKAIPYEIEDKSGIVDEDVSIKKRRSIIYGKPFSYFYQVLEKKTKFSDPPMQRNQATSVVSKLPSEEVGVQT